VQSFGSEGGDDRFRIVLKWVAKHPPSFNIFGQRKIGFWSSSYFPILCVGIMFNQKEIKEEEMLGP
jgi:hypothetical protein